MLMGKRERGGRGDGAMRLPAEGKSVWSSS